MSKKYLLFSSVGNNSHAYKDWFTLKKNRNYDIKIAYYGKKPEIKKIVNEHCDMLTDSYGSKYQNMVKLFKIFGFEKYDYVWLVDDDLSLLPTEINKMFEIVKNNKLDLAQPSMDPTGQNSHSININKKNKKINKIRYTNFVEVGCPVISKKVLLETYKKLLQLKNVILAFGVDIYWQNYFFNEKKKNFGILLMFIVRNPFPKEKKGIREIFFLKAKAHQKYKNSDYVKMLNSKPIKQIIIK